MDTKYNVTIESDGMDCDGPINHGKHELILSRAELTQEIGCAFLMHGAGSVQESEPSQGDTFTYMVFGHNHDEGFSRTAIQFYELEEVYEVLK